MNDVQVSWLLKRQLFNGFLGQRSAVVAGPITTPEGWHGHQDADRQKVMTNGVAKGGEGDVIAQKRQFHAQIKQSQQEQ